MNTPWRRITTESVTIIFSILLAFSIDAWWADRQMQQEVQESLKALRAELEGNLKLIERESNYREAVIASIEKLDSANSDPNLLSSDEVDKLLGDMTYVGQSEFSTGSLEAILQTGLFSNIENGKLQRLIASLPALYEYVWQFERTDRDSTEGRFDSYIGANGSFNQIANATGTGRPGTGEFASDFKYRVVERHDHSQLLMSNQFLGLLTQEHWEHGNVLDALQRLKPRIESAIELIDQQVP